MKTLKLWTLLSLAVVLALLATAIPVVPALAAVGTISITPTSGPVGTTVTLSGTGFTAGSTYTITFNSAAISPTGTVSGTGTISRTFVVPDAPAGARAVTVTTTGPDTSNTVNFTVTPSITLSPSSGRTGDIITVTGRGFAASPAITNIYYDGVYQTSTSNATSGYFVIGFPAPSGSGVTHTVTATDSSLNSAAASFTILSTLTISPTSLNVGMQATITGSGYGASQTITLYFDSVSTTSVTSTTTGTFTTTRAVPQGTVGSHTVTATDTLGNTASATYTITPAITITPSSFTAGSQVTVSGTGFAASSIVSFYIDSAVVNANAATTTSFGSFSATYTMPKLPGGSHSFQARDASSNSATLNFNLAQSVTISPQSGPAGTSVQVTGNSFSAAAIITISFDGTRIATSPSSPTTDAGGAFVASFIVPPGSGGNHTIVISDGTLSATTTFAIVASANISAVRGPVGTSVTVTGVSFNANGTIIITYDGNPVATVTADSGGVFSATFNVPASATGTHTVSASDGSRSMSFNFSVVASATISPTSGNVGSTVTITGTGFVSGGQINIKYDAIQIGNVTANVAGGFAAVFYAPASQGGNHSVIATDGTSTITTTFAMDSTPPPAPKLVAPINDTQADALAKFEWEAVSDPSSVTYALQVSRDANFGAPFLQKTGLTTPGYQLTEQEKLESVSKGQPYYWRVKAIDGASNESPFSTAQTFFVGFVLASWALYLIFAVVVVAVGLLGFFLGRRRALH